MPHTLFLDVRTRAEAMYVGMPTMADGLVPYVEHQELMTDWDARRGIYQLEPLQDFVPEVNRRLAQKALGDVFSAEHHHAPGHVAGHGGEA